MCFSAPSIPPPTPVPTPRRVASRSGERQTDAGSPERRRLMAGLIAGGTIRTSPLGAPRPSVGLNALTGQ